MVLLNRLEKYAERRGFFSNMQFGFQEGVGCIDRGLLHYTRDNQSYA